MRTWPGPEVWGWTYSIRYIPTALGEQVRLSPHGNVFDVDQSSLASWRNSWKFLNVDQDGASTTVVLVATL